MFPVCVQSKTAAMIYVIVYDADENDNDSNVSCACAVNNSSNDI